MARLMLEDFKGDPREFYQLVTEQVRKKQVPGAGMGEGQLRRAEGSGWTAKNETVPTLLVVDKIHGVRVLAYQFGSDFHIATSSYWADEKFAKREKERDLTVFEQIYSSFFFDTVERAIRTALVLYANQKQAPIPPDLDPKAVFSGSETRIGDGS